MVTAEEVHYQVQRFLDGTFNLDEFIDWVFENENEAQLQWHNEHPGETNRKIPNPPRTASDMLAMIELMDCEMTCSGPFRTEEMFQADLKSMLAGEPMTAFELDWDAYMAWCKQREADIERLLAPWYSKLLRRLRHTLHLRTIKPNDGSIHSN